MTDARYDKIDGRHFILIDRVPAPANLMTWARWMECASERVVASDDLGEVSVKTEFVGLATHEPGGPPLLFESVVRGGALDGVTLQHSTWDDAERGHLFLAGLVRAGR